MLDSSIVEFQTAAHRCAQEMRDNANYILQELEHVGLTDAFLEETELACAALLETNQLSLIDLHTIQELLRSPASEEQVQAIVQTLLDRFQQRTQQLHQLILKLQAASQEDRGFILASILIMESATNILGAYCQTQSAADALDAE